MGQKRGVYDRKTDIASLNAYGTYLLLDICEAVVRGSRSETLFTEGKYRFYFRHIRRVSLEVDTGRRHC